MISNEGYPKQNKLLAMQLFNYFLIADYAQTFFYKGNVASLKYLISTYDQNIVRLIDDVREALTTMYRRYFENVDVSVEYENLSATILNLNIDIEITADDKEYFKLSKALYIKDNKFTIDDKLINELNKGKR